MIDKVAVEPLTISRVVDILIELDADEVHDRETNKEYAAGAVQALSFALGIASEGVDEALLIIASAERARRRARMLS